MSDSDTDCIRDSKSSDGEMSRKEFFGLVVRRAAAAGVLAAAPAIVDKFLVPPALAQSSTCSVAATNAGPNGPDSLSGFTSDFIFTGGVSFDFTGGTVESNCTSPQAGDTGGTGPGDFAAATGGPLVADVCVNYC